MQHPINERIISIYKEYLKEKPTDFAKSIGLTKQTISGIENGMNAPSLKFIDAIKSKYPEINMNWLIAGHGEMLLSGGSGSDSGINPNTEVSGRNQISQNNGKSGTININQHNEQVFRLLEQQLAAQSITIAAQAKTIEALSQQIARLNEQLNGGNG